MNLKLRKAILVLTLLPTFLFFAAPSSISHEIIVTEFVQIMTPPDKVGIASWYSETDPYINLHTANGEIFDDSQLTCASWDYPFNTLLHVKNLENDRSVLCRVNDRGPAKRLRRVIDLTIAAFEEIAPPSKGLVRVSVSRVERTRL